MFPSLRLVLDRLRTSLWFVPAALVAGCMAGATLLLHAEQRWPLDWQLLNGAGKEGARSMLQAIASSMLTVAALVFSLTLAVLAQSAAQYSSRVVRTFMRDRGNQAVLGLFLGIYAYCLVVLRGMGLGDGMPDLAVLGGFVLALSGVAVLIYFIHHIAWSIQGANIVAEIAEETHDRIESMMEPGSGDDAPDQGEDSGEAPAWPEGAWRSIRAPRAGYVESVDTERLLDCAGRHGALVRSLVRAGDFVVHGQPLALAHSRADADSGKLDERLCRAFHIGEQRTLAEDVAYGIRQLVDVALRALSPGVNDTTTAVMALDRLVDVVRAIGRRPGARACLRDKHDRVLVWLARRDFPEYVSLAFDQIRQAADGNVAVLARMLEGLALCGAVVRDARRLAPLRRQLDALSWMVGREGLHECDQRPLQALVEEVRASLDERETALAGVADARREPAVRPPARPVPGQSG